MERAEMWALINETMQAFGPFYRELMQQAIQDSGAGEYWGLLHLARGSDPEPLTLQRMQEMAPYGAPERLPDRFGDAVQGGMLERVGDGIYKLTDLGREAVEGVFEAAHRGLAVAEPLPAGEMDQLTRLLQRIVEATLQAPEPAEKWALRYSRWTDPGEDAPGTVRVDQYLTDLLRFRDDAHIAAWRPYGVDGRVWDTLTFVWREQAHSAEDLLELLPFRGFTVQEYQAALDELAGKGWLEEKDGAYELTKVGRQVREEAEEATNHHCFVGWSALNKQEQVLLVDLLSRTRANLWTETTAQAWGLLGELAQAVPTVAQDVVRPMFAEYGLDQPARYFILLSANRNEPEPLSAAGMHLRGPYSNVHVYEQFLSQTAEAGLLEARSDGEYVLSDRGRSVLHKVNHAFYTRLGEIEALPVERMSQVEELLGRIVQACLEAPEPEDKGVLLTTHRGHPGEVYAPLARIDQHMDDLRAFRDDAHLASWRPYDISGHAWEAMTLVWRGEAHTAEELAGRAFRGYSVEDYAETLEGLAGRGLLEKTEQGYLVTEKGRALRQEAEEATDRYFFVPWSCLGHGELVQLHWLLTQLRNGLREMIEDSADAAQ